MKKALKVFVRVAFVISAFDIAIVVGKCYWWNIDDSAVRTIVDEAEKIDSTGHGLKFMARAVKRYMNEKKKIPISLSAALVEDNSTLYTDRWGNKMRLEQKAGHIRVVSAGPDGKFQTDDDLWCDVRNVAE